MKKIAFVFMMIILAFILEINAMDRDSIGLTAEVTGEGPAVIFLPALGCDPSIYADTVIKLSSTHSCHLIAIPGFAGSSIAESYNSDELTNAVIGYMEKNHLDRVTLIGHSFSGWLAMKIAAATSRVGRLVIIDSAPYPAGLYRDIDPENARNQASVLSGMITSMNEERYRSFEESRLSLMVRSPEWRERIAGWLCASDRKMIAQLTAEMTGSDLRPLLKKINVPVLILASWTMGKMFGLDREVVERRYADQYRELTGARILFSENGGHFIPIDDPEWYTRQMESFIGQE